MDKVRKRSNFVYYVFCSQFHNRLMIYFLRSQVHFLYDRIFSDYNFCRWTKISCFIISRLLDSKCLQSSLIGRIFVKFLCYLQILLCIFFLWNRTFGLLEMYSLFSLFSPVISIIDFLDIVQFVVDFICIIFNMILEYVDANTTRATTTTITTITTSQP
jgi:hypothetical protein